MSLSLKPTHAAVKAYYETLHQYGQLYIDHEGAVSGAFASLLSQCGKKVDPKLTLVQQYPIQRGKSLVRVDGALVDLYNLAHGYWEAKDEKDDLAREVQRKLDKGYPRDNIIFQAPERAILYQSGTRIFDENISRPEALISVVNQFFDYKMPHIEEWERAVDEFSDRIPELATAVKATIDEEKRRNPSFVRVFDDFYALCRQAINPNLSEEAVERMLIQHLLTERIFRKIFNNPDFSHRNVVAAEIEKVIAELTKRSLNRDEFLKRLEPFYHAIERNVENATEYAQKQDFINTVYMRFFQGYSPKEADTHGIVYTPQPIVNFMVRSVAEILQKEFGRSLSDKGVHILDPFVGTGNFIVRTMQEIKTTDLPYKYENELHCNEVSYIASMNIEHAYFERTDEYKAFPGICLVDTFELAESKQAPMFTEQNTQRVERQKAAPIFVIIGNPPYNAWQVDENDNNRNRKYVEMEKRISETYVKDSKATLMNSLRDPYVKALRWSADRIGSEGIVALITNSGFLDSVAADGIRKHLVQDFDEIYALDLGGDVRLNPRISGTTHNVFGIKIGVSINLFVRRAARRGSPCKIRYAKTDEFWRKEQKYAFLESTGSREGIPWQDLVPDHQSNWLNAGQRSDFNSFLQLGNKELKSMSRELSGVVFASFSNGAKSNNDSYVYNFDPEVLKANAKAMAEAFNAESDRWRRAGRPRKLDNFLHHNVKVLKWIRHTKRILLQGQDVSFDENKIRTSLYRPFCALFYYFDRTFNEDLYSLPKMLPTPRTENENRLIVAPNVGGRTSFWTLCSSRLPNLSLISIDANQCFPFYTYAEDGTHRRENITDWVLDQFRSRYADPSITKWDIFHYIYAILHHPEYRQRYAANLRRELPSHPLRQRHPSTVIPSGAGSFGHERSCGVESLP